MMQYVFEFYGAKRKVQRRVATHGKSVHDNGDKKRRYRTILPDEQSRQTGQQN